MADNPPDDFKKLDSRMRTEWDRRIAHDYRYWMSDGVESDALMWEVGERDFSILFKHADLSNSPRQQVLELGCGVGRLLRAASKRFEKAIGIDVSEKALCKARELLADVPNVSVILGSGHDLHEFADASLDVAYSFAALGSMPVSIFANYLVELSRILKPGGQLLLQLYLGRMQQIPEEDTLSLRSYDRERFIAAANVAGFHAAHLQELILPFEVSDVERGVVAYIVTLKRTESNPVTGQSAHIPQNTLSRAEQESVKCRSAQILSDSGFLKHSDVDEINQMRGLSGFDKHSRHEFGKCELVAKVLGIEGEEQAGSNWKGSLTEYYMAIARARQHLDAGCFLEAKQALEFALLSYPEPEETFFEMLSILRSHDARMASELIGDSSLVAKLEVMEASEMSPQHIAEQLAANGSPIICYNGLPLDQQSNPERAAAQWVERSLDEPRLKHATSIIVAGIATGYHLSELARRTTLPLIVFEPRVDLLKYWLANADRKQILDRFEAIYTTTSELLSCSLLGDTPELLIHPQSRAISGTEFSELNRLLIGSRGLATLAPAIALVGPIYGGTLPMTDYVARALAQLGQRVHVYNLGDFHKSYAAVNNFVTNQNRLDYLENQYVEFLSDLVLEGIREKPVDILISLAQAPLSPRALKELRSRGVITAMWFVEDCGRFPTWKVIAPYYDFMFVIQKEKYPEMIEQAGAGRCYYIPTACDPQIHHPLELSAEEQHRWGSDLSFVGAGYHNRRKMFARLTQSNFRIWGTEWPESRPFDTLVQEKGRRISPEDYVKIFNATTINLNLHSSSERDGVDPHGDFVNPRTFELAACGSFQLVDRRSLLPELFTEDSEIVCFSNEKELRDKIEYYIGNPTKRIEIAKRGRDRALKEHTYVHRLKSMLSYIFAERYAELQARANNTPWSRILKAAESLPSVKQRFEQAFKLGREPVLDSIVCDIQLGKGELTDEESKLLFLHHVRKFISTAQDLNEGRVK